MTIPLQFASLYDRQEVFVWSNCLLDLGTDFLVGNMVFVSYIQRLDLVTTGESISCNKRIQLNERAPPTSSDTK